MLRCKTPACNLPQLHQVAVRHMDHMGVVDHVLGWRHWSRGGHRHTHHVMRGRGMVHVVDDLVVILARTPKQMIFTPGAARGSLGGTRAGNPPHSHQSQS